MPLPSYNEMIRHLRDRSWTSRQVEGFKTEMVEHGEGFPATYELAWGKLNTPSNTRKLMMHSKSIEDMFTKNGGMKSKIRQWKLINDGIWKKTDHGKSGEPAITKAQWRAIRANRHDNQTVKFDEATGAIIIL